SRTSLYDDGNYSGNGDAVAGDGIFSRVLSISPTNQKGTYRFDFEAKDRGGLVSQVVPKYIVVK
ncbi:MAG: choice-of-anchor X domain-containing protein, partial [Ignavibacteriaceae bacterium]